MQTQKTKEAQKNTVQNTITTKNSKSQKHKTEQNIKHETKQNNAKH